MKKLYFFLFSFLIVGASFGQGTIEVTSTLNSGPGTLREAITNAADGTTIIFADYVDFAPFESEIVIPENKTIIIEGEGILFEGQPVMHGNRMLKIPTTSKLLLNGITLKKAKLTDEDNGGAIENLGYLAVSNCSFLGNKAKENGGAIYNAGYLAVINSTFYANEAGSNGGAIYNENGAVMLLNSIFIGNTVNNSAQDIYSVKTGANLTYLHMAGCIYGNLSQNHDNAGAFINILPTTGPEVTVESVFGEANPSFEMANILPIFATGPAALNGILVGFRESDNKLLFRSRNENWRDFSTENQFTFVDSYPSYGFTGGTVIIAAQNNVDRVLTHEAYNVGASALLPEEEKTVVDLAEDLVNPFDKKYSLREVVIRAATNKTITFANNVSEITLLSEIEIPGSKTLTIKGEEKKVILKGQNGVNKNRIFKIPSTATLTLDGLTLTEGEILNGYGGAIENMAGKLTVINSTFYNNKAGDYGGAISNDGTLTVINSTFYNNTAGTGGGAIFSFLRTEVTLLNAILTGNSAVKGKDIFLPKVDGNPITLRMAGCIYGELENEDGFNTVEERNNTTGPDASVANVFVSAMPTLVNGMLPISATGAAAFKGTLTGQVGTHWYFRDGDNWESFTGGATYLFDSAASPFGLTGGTVYTAAQNPGDDRIATHLAYNAGAYALPLGTTDPLVVDSDDDILNPFDDKNTLREAVSYAATQPTASGITFNGVTNITLLSEITIPDNSNIAINGAETVTLRGRNGDTNQNRIFVVHQDAALALAGLTLMEGKVSGDAGGAIFNAGTLMVASSAFSGNEADAGGAIANAGDFTVRNSIFHDNEATSGGAIAHQNGTLMIEASFFNGNTANASGGAIANQGGILIVVNSTFDANIAAGAGGAIAHQGGTLTVMNSIFDANEADDGGAIHNENGTLVVDNSTFEANTATDAGGAIHNKNEILMVENSTFFANTATDAGGAIHNEEGTATLLHATFYNNIATNAGGAIHNIDGTATLLNAILTGNMANSGKDISSEQTAGTATLRMAGCIYGDLSQNHNGTFTEKINTTGEAASVLNVFGADPAALDASGMLLISASGAAALNGTLVGNVNATDTWYFRNGANWENFIGATTYPFDSADLAGFGLPGGAVYENSQNGVSRTASHAAYNAGAYALTLATKNDPLLVTSAGDTPNPFDPDGITLREAVEEAISQGGETITIDPATGNITLGLPALDITEPITITGQNELILAEVNVTGDGKITLEGGVKLNNYTVTFNTLGGSIVDQLTNIGYGSVIDAPADPTFTNYIFGGWYKEATFSNAWSFGAGGDEVTGNITLYAKWQTRPITPQPDPSDPPVAVLHTVIIGETEGATTYPAAGTYQMEEGVLLVMQVFVSDDYDKSTVSLLVNGQTVEPDESSLLRAEAYIFRFPVTEDLKIEIAGVKHNNPIGIENPSDLRQGEAKVWTNDGRIYVSSPNGGGQVGANFIRIYSLTGQLIVNETFAADGSLFSARVPRGLYIVAAGNKTFKVSVGK